MKEAAKGWGFWCWGWPRAFWFIGLCLRRRYCCNHQGGDAGHRRFTW